MSGTSERKSILERSPVLVFCVLVLISVVIWWNPLAASFALALRDERYTHLLLILPISIALTLLDWKPSAPSIRSGASLGFGLLGVAVLIYAATRWKADSLSAGIQLSLNMLALVVWWIAVFVVAFGTRAFRRSLFPLCFLFWLVPLPESVLSEIVSMLQQGSAAAAYLLFAMFRVPVEQHGLLLHIPDLILAVAPECSSIRSSLILVVTTMVLAHLLLRSPWRKAIVVALAIPLSIAKNGLRIFTIGMLGTRVDPSYLTGRLHHQGGIVFFLVALAAMLLMLWGLRRWERQNPAGRVKPAVLE